MAQDTAYLEAALGSLDVQLNDLGIRLSAQADELKRLLEEESDYDSLRSAVNAAADRIQADAVAVSKFAQPSAVVDPEQPGEATPVPTDPSEPIPAPEDSSTV